MKLEYDEEEMKLERTWLLVGKLITTKKLNKNVFEDLIRRVWARRRKVDINPSRTNTYSRLN